MEESRRIYFGIVLISYKLVTCRVFLKGTQKRGREREITCQTNNYKRGNFLQTANREIALKCDNGHTVGLHYMIKYSDQALFTQLWAAGISRSDDC